MKQIQPFLMFKKNAEEAAEFYVKLFPNSKILSKTRWGAQEMKFVEEKFTKEQIPGKAGEVRTVMFEINGQRFEAGNGGSPFDFAMGVSMCTNCESQDEIDQHTTALLSGGGEQLDCGWVKDKFGVFWQVIPATLPVMLNSHDERRAEQVVLALYQMKKIDMAKLQKAFDAPMKERPVNF